MPHTPGQRRHHGEVGSESHGAAPIGDMRQRLPGGQHDAFQRLVAVRHRIGLQHELGEGEVGQADAGDEEEAGAPAKARHRGRERCRGDDAADIARHLRDARHHAEPFVGETLRDEFQERGEDQCVAAGNDEARGKNIEQVRRQRKRCAAQRRGGHAEQHHALDAVAVDQKACRNLHQGVAPEVAGGEHRDAGRVGAEIVHEAQADRLRRHALQERDGIGDGHRRPGQIGTVAKSGDGAGEQTACCPSHRHHTLA